ncbi:hypothetical protein FGIG_08023 [Fasciola gigantica]|uniref:Uncharacterized protein n=1 Tax=Fasciola gigantica TaxID=46835 RepID=A0A504YTC5_FASGI|nr:hypothetical protein FGIG_08023 [Fasciola gigantica]
MKIRWCGRLRLSTWSYGGRQCRYQKDEDLLSVPVAVIAQVILTCAPIPLLKNCHVEWLDKLNSCVYRCLCLFLRFYIPYTARGQAD